MQGSNTTILRSTDFPHRIWGGHSLYDIVDHQQHKLRGDNEAYNRRVLMELHSQLSQKLIPDFKHMDRWLLQNIARNARTVSRHHIRFGAMFVALLPAVTIDRLVKVVSTPDELCSTSLTWLNTVIDTHIHTVFDAVLLCSTKNAMQFALQGCPMTVPYLKGLVKLETRLVSAIPLQYILILENPPFDIDEVLFDQHNINKAREHISIQIIQRFMCLLDSIDDTIPLTQSKYGFIVLEVVTLRLALYTLAHLEEYPELNMTSFEYQRLTQFLYTKACRQMHTLLPLDEYVDDHSCTMAYAEKLLGYVGSTETFAQQLVGEGAAKHVFLPTQMIQNIDIEALAMYDMLYNGIILPALDRGTPAAMILDHMSHTVGFPVLQIEHVSIALDKNDEGFDSCVAFHNFKPYFFYRPHMGLCITNYHRASHYNSITGCWPTVRADYPAEAKYSLESWHFGLLASAIGDTDYTLCKIFKDHLDIVSEGYAMYEMHMLQAAGVTIA